MLFRRLSIYVFIIVSLFGALGCHEGGEEGLPPEVTLEGGRIFRTELGSDVTIAPSFAHLTDNAVIRWMLDEQWVGDGETYTFKAEESGVYYLSVEVTTEFGKAYLEVRIDVAPPTPPEPPKPPVDSARVSFERSEYHVSLGRTIRLLPPATGRSSSRVQIRSIGSKPRPRDVSPWISVWNSTDRPSSTIRLR